MKRLLKNKYFIGAVIAALLAVTGFAVYKVQQDFKKQDPGQNTTNESKEVTPTVKTDNPPAETTQNQDNGTGQTVVNSNLGTLSGVSVTVYLNKTATTSLDGKTSIPANSMTAYFYMEPGVYSVQKLVGAGWQDVATNNNYPGHGGLAVPYLGPTEDNVSYRVVKIENGTAKSVSKTFIVRRSDLSSGSKTYN